MHPLSEQRVLFAFQSEVCDDTENRIPCKTILWRTKGSASSVGSISSQTMNGESNSGSAVVKAEGDAGTIPQDIVLPPHLARMAERLNDLWRRQQQEMEELGVGSKQDFKHHNDLPLARIKRIMKSDEDVRMISAEAPILFAKACELFILELTVRAWCFSEHHKRNGLEREDVLAVLQNTDIFDFLAAVVINNPEGRPSSISSTTTATGASSGIQTSQHHHLSNMNSDASSSASTSNNIHMKSEN